MKINYIINLLVVFSALQAWTQETAGHESIFPLSSSGSLRFDVDICQMDGPGDSTAVEVIYSVFMKAENRESYMTTLSIDLQISDKSGRQLAGIAEAKEISLFDSLDQSKYTTFMDIKRINVWPDTVVLELKINESLQGTKGQVNGLFKIRDLKKHFSVGDLYFASHVQRSKGNSVFDKGGLMLIPNPSRLFFVNGEAPKIYVYYEINNLTYDTGKPTFYEANAVVYDVVGNEVFKAPVKQIKVSSENTARINVVPIKKVNSGVYQLAVEVIDIASGQRKEVDGYFKVDRGNREATNILPMSVEEEQKYLDQIRYISTESEKDLFGRLDARGKQEFLLNFWKSKDPTPGTPENEFMIEHFRRLDVAKNKFRGGGSSDMGRIYIKYGEPEDIERENAMQIGAQVIEIWTYILDGRTDFIFVDRDGDGKYALVHSTHRDEYSNPNWRDQITTGGN